MFGIGIAKVEGMENGSPILIMDGRCYYFSSQEKRIISSIEIDIPLIDVKFLTSRGKATEWWQKNIRIAWKSCNPSYTSFTDLSPDPIDIEKQNKKKKKDKSDSGWITYLKKMGLKPEFIKVDLSPKDEDKVCVKGLIELEDGTTSPAIVSNDGNVFYYANNGEINVADDEVVFSMIRICVPEKIAFEWFEKNVEIAKSDKKEYIWFVCEGE